MRPKLFDISRANSFKPPVIELCIGFMIAEWASVECWWKDTDGKIEVRTYLHTYVLMPCSWVLLEKLTGPRLVKKFPAFYGTRRFITAFTSARHLSLSWARLIQSMPPHPTSWRFILIISSHLHLGLPSGLFPPGFPTKTLYTPVFYPILVTCPVHLIILHFIAQTMLGAEYRSLSSSLCSLLHSPVTSSLLGPNILLNTLFSNTLSPHSSLSVGDQVSHPHKTTGTIILPYILIFKFLDSKLEDKRFSTEDSKHSLTSVCS